MHSSGRGIQLPQVMDVALILTAMLYSHKVALRGVASPSSPGTSASPFMINAAGSPASLLRRARSGRRYLAHFSLIRRIYWFGTIVRPGTNMSFAEFHIGAGIKTGVRYGIKTKLHHESWGRSVFCHD